MTHPIEKLDVHQVAALMRWKHEHGHRWRSDLLQAWRTCNYHPTSSDDGALLHQIRNLVGPSGLAKIKLD